MDFEFAFLKLLHFPGFIEDDDWMNLQFYNNRHDFIGLFNPGLKV